MKYGFSEDAIADLDEICADLGRYSVKAAGKLFDRKCLFSQQKAVKI